MYLRLPASAAFLLFTLGVLTGSPRAIAQSSTQSGATPLPAVEVTAGQPKKKTAKAKTAKKSAAPVAQAPTSMPAATQAAATGGSGEGATRPGLNLDVPAQTGSRLGLTPLETPASVEVIPGTTIHERGQTSVDDAVTQNATGFTSTASPGNGWASLGTRGFVGNNAVMRLYDGTRLYVGAGTITFPFDTWSAERIEVLRGPASVLYGEGSIGGVVNVVPKRPTDYFTADGEVAYGTDNTKRFGVGMGGPVSDQLGYRLDVSGTQSDGWLDQNGEFSKLAISGSVVFKPTNDLKFTLSNDFGDQSPMKYQGTPLINGSPEPVRFTNFNVDDSELHFRDNWTQLKAEWDVNDWLSLRNTTYYLTSNRHWRNTEWYEYMGGNVVERWDWLEIYHDQEQVGNRFDAAFRTALGGGVKNELVVGFDVNRVKFRHTNNYSDPNGEQNNGDVYDEVDPFNFVPGKFLNPDGTVPVFDTTTQQYSLFAEDRLVLSKELSVVAGIRLDHPTVERVDLNGAPANVPFEKSFSDVTWRVGAVYSPVRDLAFYGQYSTGVDPVGGIISLNASNAPWVLATGRQIEIGMKQAFWHGRGEWTLAAYDIEKQNLLSRDPSAPGNNYRQVGQQSSRGVEASLALQVLPSLRYEGNVALLQARYDDFVSRTSCQVGSPDCVGGFKALDYSGNRPTNVPEQVVNNWLSWAFLPKWEAHVGVRWVGSMYGDDSNEYKRAPFTVVNLGLDYEVTDKSEIALRVYNVFDEIYATDGGSTQWQLAPPRTGEIVYRMKY